jgi:hypothetical protein
MANSAGKEFKVVHAYDWQHCKSSTVRRPGEELGSDMDHWRVSVPRPGSTMPLPCATELKETF